ncbi:hypothetical protein JYU34_010670 [Plutella xylostella]|uniref:Uncharacterized protein n=1 Tax=Plutella xylostella TaxID=51655 RepID=A0ABQ7QEY5_PLUXY|nr:hypothetical protein JYU34_010670 [Plutella xylostella]
MSQREFVMLERKQFLLRVLEPSAPARPRPPPCGLVELRGAGWDELDRVEGHQCLWQVGVAGSDWARDAPRLPQCDMALRGHVVPRLR